MTVPPVLVSAPTLPSLSRLPVLVKAVVVPVAVLVNVPEFVTSPAPPELVKLPELVIPAVVPELFVVPELLTAPTVPLFVKLLFGSVCTSARVPVFVRLPFPLTVVVPVNVFVPDVVTWFLTSSDVVPRPSEIMPLSVNEEPNPAERRSVVAPSLSMLAAISLVLDVEMSTVPPLPRAINVTLLSAKGTLRAVLR